MAVLQQKKDREVLELQEQVMRLSYSIVVCEREKFTLKHLCTSTFEMLSFRPHEGEGPDVLHGGTVSSQGVTSEG